MRTTLKYQIWALVKKKLSTFFIFLNFDFLGRVFEVKILFTVIISLRYSSSV